MQERGTFNARRLRSPRPPVWRWRLLTGLGALLSAAGVLLLLATLASLLGEPVPLLQAPLALPGSALLGASAALLLYTGIALWRVARRHRRHPEQLAFARDLLKRRH